MNEMLDPCEVGVACRRGAIFPSNILPQEFTLPVADIKRRIGEDVVCLQVFVDILPEAVRMMRADVAINSSDGEVHLAEPPCRGI